MAKAYKCRECGAPIRFEPGKDGKSIAVEPGGVYYIPGRNGDAVLIGPCGTAERGIIVDREFMRENPECPVKAGSVPHWAKCRGPELKREKRRRLAAEEKERREREKAARRMNGRANDAAAKGQLTFF